jgi:hypothetical protein
MTEKEDHDIGELMGIIVDYGKKNGINIIDIAKMTSAITTTFIEGLGQLAKLAQDGVDSSTNDGGVADVQHTVSQLKAAIDKMKTKT